MATKLIKRRGVEYVETYRLLFDRIVNGEEVYHFGFGFDCDKNGKVIDPSHPSYLACLSGTVDGAAVGTGYVETFSFRKQVAGELRCDCRRLVYLNDAMTNQCECGRFYNGSGQQLSHPRHWGEETGEQFDDSGRQIL